MHTSIWSVHMCNLLGMQPAVLQNDTRGEAQCNSQSLYLLSALFKILQSNEV